MGNFNFRLQRLLGYRSIQEEEAKRELGLRRIALEEETARLKGLEEEETALYERWREQVQREIALPHLQVTEEYSRLLDNRLNSQAEKYHHSKHRVDEQREVAGQCWRRKRVLEILKDKARIEHLHRENIRERNFIDEVVINSFTRKGGD